jgi:Ni/Co efflux regulator RcnB
MNKFLIAAAALSLAAPSIAAAQPFDHQRDGRDNAQGDQHQHADWGHDHGDGRDNAQGDQRQHADWGHDHGDGGGRGQNDDHQHANWGRDYGGGHHFHRGERMGYNDWSGAQQVDYHRHHLRRPPYGYEWRESNGQFILGAVATGLIVSAIIDSNR